MRLVAASLAMALLAGAAASAQVVPTPGPDSPRIQSVQWVPGQSVVLVSLPQTTLTVMLDPRETIRRATLGGSRAWDVSIAAEANSFQVTPQLGASPANLLIETDERTYEFSLETSRGLLAAYIVRVTYGPGDYEPEFGREEIASAAIENLTWSYRLRGDRSVRPLSVRDNGDKTVIEYAPGQSLPAVFAKGPSGDEEVVDGYMRGDVFVIDRVHQELVFRIDKEKATARRNRREDEAE